MSLQEVEDRATELSRWPRRGFMDWLMERGPEWGTDEAEGDLCAALGEAHAAETRSARRRPWQGGHGGLAPRLVTMYELRRDA